MSGYRAEGVVLRTRPLGEADLVVTLYTAEEGKIEAVARGGRRLRSRLLGCIQPFSHGRYFLWRGRTLDSLSQGELVRSFRELREDLLRMACASYLAELVDGLTPEREPSRAIFSLLLEGWGFLAGSPPETNSVLNGVSVFELRLLNILGYAPQLWQCLSCKTAEEGEWYFGIRTGGLLCARCASQDETARPVSGETLGGLRQLASTPLARAGVLRLSPGARAEMRELLKGYCIYRAERELKSAGFLDLVRG